MTSYPIDPTKYGSEVFPSQYADVDTSYLTINPLPIYSVTAAGKAMEADANTLAKLLSPVRISEYASIAEQIFGSQAQRQKLSLEHLFNLIDERSILHRRHLTEIQRRHMDVHAQMEAAKLNHKLDNGRMASQLQSALIHCKIMKLCDIWRRLPSVEWLPLRHQMSFDPGRYKSSYCSKICSIVCLNFARS